MRILFLIAFLFLLQLGCKKTCTVESFSKVSHISFPKNIEFVACKDNGEYMSALALKLKKEDINSFCQKNHFEKTKDDFVINFWGMRLLDSSFCKFPSKSSLYFKEGRNKVNTWVYLIDTSNGCVFGEIQYPDWSGDAP